VPAYRHVYDLDGQALANLAYFFDFGYGDGRDVASYTSALAGGVAAWKEHHAGTDLAGVDRGTELVVIDTRAAARQRVTVLPAAERAVLLACDAPAAPGGLTRAVARDIGAEAVGPALRRLLHLGFVVEHGDRLLGLPILGPVPESPDGRPRPGAATRPGHPSAAS
jgi:hypothetical protein